MAANGWRSSAACVQVRNVDQVRAELDGILEGLRKTWASQNRYLETRAGVFPLDNALMAALPSCGRCC